MHLMDGYHLIIPLVLLAGWVLWIAALVDSLRRPDAQWRAAGHSKTLFVLLIIFLGWLGALLYAVIPRPALKRSPA